MAEKKNLSAQIDIDLHRKITEAKEQAGLTTAEYITNLLLEYYEMKENGGKQIMATNGTRTMAFQIPEDLFQRIKAHLERETARTGKKLTQREFVLGLIKGALNMAEPMDVDESGIGPCEAPETSSGSQSPDSATEGSMEPCGAGEGLAASEEK